MATEASAGVRTDAVKTYLNDHQAGAMGGEELAASLSEHLPQHADLSTIAGEIAEDRKTLQRLMDKFDAQGSSVKQAGAMMMEKIGASVFGGGSEASQNIVFLKQIEILKMGVHGKLCLWQALGEVSDSDERLAGFNFERLAGRAQDQIDGLSTCHLAITRKALLA